MQNQVSTLTCETKQAIKHMKHRNWKHKVIGKEAIKTNMWKQKQNKQKKKKIRVFRQQPACVRTSLCAHNQACVHRQDYAYASSCLENHKSTTKLKTLNLTP